jgi:outer membrane biogenesis lipoprotein LolB
MKRLALLVVSTFMTLLLTACGDNTGHKTGTTKDTTQSQSNLNNANKDVNAELSSDANVKKADTQSQDANTTTNP